MVLWYPGLRVSLCQRPSVQAGDEPKDDLGERLGGQHVADVGLTFEHRNLAAGDGSVQRGDALREELQRSVPQGRAASGP